jgi:hypothetical protein
MGALAVTLGQVKQDTGRSAVKLISRGEFGGQLLDEGPNPGNKSQCLLINPELFVVKGGGHIGVENEKDNEND